MMSELSPQMTLKMKNNKIVSGTIRGKITLLGVTSDFTYLVPGDFCLKTEIPTFQVSLKNIIYKLADITWNTTWYQDTHFTFGLSQIYIKIDKSQKIPFYSFVLRSPLSFGVCLINIFKMVNNWGFVCGINLNSSKISSLPGLENLSVVEEEFQFNKVLFLMSTHDLPQNYQFPDQQILDTPANTYPSIQLPSNREDLKAGVYFFSSMTMANKPGYNLVKQFLKLPNELDISAYVSDPPTKETRIYAHFESTPLKGLELKGDIGGIILNGKFEFYFQAKLTLQKFTFNTTLALMENGIYFSGSLDGTSINLFAFKLKDINAIIGVGNKGDVRFGLIAVLDINITNIESSIAIFYDPEDPTKELLAGSISKLSLKDVIEFLTDGASLPNLLEKALDQIRLEGISVGDISSSISTSLNNMKIEDVSNSFKTIGISLPTSLDDVFWVVEKPNELWHITDLSNELKHYTIKSVGDKVEVLLDPQFYWCTQDIQLGENISCKQGFSLNGKITFFGVSVTAKIDIEPKKGIAIDVVLSPITVGAILSFTSSDGKSGPYFSLSTYNNPSIKDPKKNGPHILVSGSLKMLGLGLDLDVSVTENGLFFEINAKVLFGCTFNLYGTIKSLDNFAGGGKASVKIDTTINLGKLGNLPINVGFDVSLDFGLQNSQAFVNCQADFEFAHHQFSIVKFALSVDASPLTHLVDTIIDKIKEVILDFVKEAVKWLSWIKDGIIKGVEEIGKVLKEVFKLEWKVAAQLLADVGYAYNEVVTIVKEGFGILESDINAFLDKLGKFCAVSQANNALSRKQLFIPKALAYLSTIHTPSAQTLLYHYYLNQDEIQRIFRCDSSLLDRFIRPAVTINNLVEVLDIMCDRGTDELQTSILMVKEILLKYKEESYNSFIEKLQSA